MSGYKHTGRSQEDYQARAAWAAYLGVTDLHYADASDIASAAEAWEALPQQERQRWHAVAAVVRDDTRTEPRF